MTAARVLLLVPAVTYRAGDFLAAAQRMGLDVVVGSDGALPLLAGSVLRADPDDLAGIDRLLAGAGPLDAVVAADTPMLPLATAAAARLGLPHNSPRSIAAAMDKAAQRRLWAAAGVRQPAFQVVRAGDGDAIVAGAAAEVGLPCVVKPVSLSGSRGVLLACDAAAAVTAAGRVRRILAEARRPADEPLMVEEYVRGREVSVDGLLRDGGLIVTAVFDKPDGADGPTFEERMLVTPPALPGPALAAVSETARQAALALGLRRGPIHAEMRIPGGGAPAMLELAARSIGGLCSRALRSPSGPSLEELVLADALDRPVAPAPPARPAGVLMLHPRADGVLWAVNGVEAAAAVPGVTGVSITVPCGQRIRPLPEGDRYLGFVFATGDTHDEVTAALRAARKRLVVIVD